PRTGPPTPVPTRFGPWPEGSGLSRSAHSQRTTPSSQFASGCVTITHPHHPLRGQQLSAVCVRHGASPDVIVRLPDGSHAAAALSATDYAVAPLAAPPAVAASP